ncbi:DNA repair and recombination protein RadA [archaeon]|jgi:DNA repair protein RadA|nr:DNA repair and recombination protein RadA [archaeon]MBT3451015.1 DNA repair and recombination protein RadA [archaeon]MBT6868565.1 DNA repair and recombination protein RadA [archaeon]MBT7193097.1 DNA repair and recombination protein RadA [archaeon]MBT7380414.1 DNA repair and recombination protein RadA [archaeon]
MSEENNNDVQNLPGVGAATAEKLVSSGYHDMLSIAVASPGQLVDSTGVSEAVARKMINAARDNMNMGFETGTEVMVRRGQVIKISCGCSSFNTLLGGGFETGAIVECFGEFGSGKTQIGHVLAVQLLKAYPNASVVYIDTENTFRPERIEQLARAAELDVEDTLSKIIVARAYNSDHQMLLAEKVDGLIKEQGKDVKLLVVDSLTAHFRAEFIGRGTLAERQQKLNRHMHTLGRLSSSNNMCVFVTNQVMSKPDQFFGDPTTAIGGHVVAHASTFRIYLRKGKKGTRVAKLIDAPNLPDGECVFEVVEGGLNDV